MRVVVGESVRYNRIYLGRTDFSIDLAIYVLVSCHGSAFQACVGSRWVQDCIRARNTDNFSQQESVESLLIQKNVVSLSADTRCR